MWLEAALLRVDTVSDMQALRRPEPFARYTTPEFWNDPHISEQMLAYHLDPVLEPASRAHSFIERSVAWLVPVLGLVSGSRLLDLGCGPGLYGNRIAALGVEVVGIDVSRRSLEYAREEATSRGLPSAFREGSYLDCGLGEGYDATILIYEDYCALSPAQRAALLARTHDALRPGGRLLFDVTATPRFAEFHDAVVEGTNLMDGFWAQPPYVGVQETWTYPDLHLVLQRYTIETGTRTREFWNWMHCLSPDEVSSELARAGFGAPRLFGDVAGAPYVPSSPTFTVLTSRA